VVKRPWVIVMVALHVDRCYRSRIELVVNRQKDDAFPAIRNAFDAMRRRLEDYVRQQPLQMRH
jgi:hypothetical protein